MSELATVIPVRMKPNTLQQVDHLQECVHSPNRSDAIRRAIEISSTLLRAVELGGKIVIEGVNGRRTQILITGLS